MSSGREIEKAVAFEANPLEGLVFPIALPGGATANLAQTRIAPRRGCDKFLIYTAIDWQATFGFEGIAIFSVPGFVQVTFEILINEEPVYRVTETAVQVGTGVNIALTEPTVVFKTTGLLHSEKVFDNFKEFCVPVISLRATDIILSPPATAIGTPITTATANVGSVTMVVEQMR